MDDRYDVLVVGSGSAGAIVAARIAARGSARVGLVEAGNEGRNPLFRVPLMAGSLFRFGFATWRYETEPEPGLNGRRIAWPRGRVLGGTSMINGMVYLRGLPGDYDRWATAGLPDWSWERVRPHFERSAHMAGDVGAPDSMTSPIGRPARPTNPLFPVFLDAAQQAGWPRTESLNHSPYGVGYYDFTMKGGERWSASRVFLARGKRPANLTVLTGTRALKIDVRAGRAEALQVESRGVVKRLRAREIILCCGAIGTPALLFQSGIGDPADLKAAGIAPAHGLRGVGRNLQDHLLVRIEYACTQPVTLHNLMRADRAGLALAQAILFRNGPAATFPIEVGGFLKTDASLREPDIQTHFLPGLSTAKLRTPFSGDGQGHGFFASACKMRPESRGRLAPSSADPLPPPRIFAGYLSDERDVATLREGIGVIRDIVAQPAFDGFRGAEGAPGGALRSRAELDAYVRATANTVFHPVGTCRMGHDEDSVVDGELRVRGIERLRIVDASIMPTLTSANTHAPTMMIGEKGAAYAIAELGL